MKRMKKLYWSFSFIIIFCIILFFFFGNPVNYYTLRGEFKKLLEEKHNQEFIVNRISFDVMHRTYHSYATPKSEPKLKFYIGQSNVTKEIIEDYDYIKKMRMNEKDRMRLCEISPDYC
ncbi:hypothetical protein ACFO9Q_10460 [Paenibacillus sp. GCM10023252]|uniref:hypothetical protein n=1 Tax=Paenibacillus sp. GCM10023252 TaxID=3252649 RepID=UPI0036103308